MTSLPVPVSPEIKTVALVGATASTWERIERGPPRRPTMVSRNEERVRSGLHTTGLSAENRVTPVLIAFSSYRPASVMYSALEIIFPPFHQICQRPTQQILPNNIKLAEPRAGLLLKLPLEQSRVDSQPRQ